MVLVLLDGDESDPVSDLVLLQVSLGEVLQVLTGELSVGNNDNLGTFLGDRDVLTQVTDNTVDLDVLNQELDVRGWVENTVFGWSRSVNDELLSSLGLLGGLYSVSLLHFLTNNVKRQHSPEQGMQIFQSRNRKKRQDHGGGRKWVSPLKNSPPNLSSQPLSKGYAT